MVIATFYFVDVYIYIYGYLELFFTLLFLSFTCILPMKCILIQDEISWTIQSPQILHPSKITKYKIRGCVAISFQLSWYLLFMLFKISPKQKLRISLCHLCHAECMISLNRSLFVYWQPVMLLPHTWAISLLLVHFTGTSSKYVIFSQIINHGLHASPNFWSIKILLKSLKWFKIWWSPLIV